MQDKIRTFELGNDFVQGMYEFGFLSAGKQGRQSIRFDRFLVETGEFLVDGADR